MIPAGQNCWSFVRSGVTRDWSMLDHFNSLPAIRVVSDQYGSIDWYASEYLYEDSPGVYCLAIDPFASDDELILGGSMMK